MTLLQRPLGGWVLALALAALAGCDKKSSGATPPADSAGHPARLTPAGRAALAARAAGSAADGGAQASNVVISDVRVRPKEPTTVHIAWKTPSGTAVNDEAPFRVRWDSSEGLADAPADMKSTGNIVKEGFTVKVRPMQTSPSAMLEGELNLVVCDSVNHAICLPVRRSLQMSFVVAPDAKADTNVTITLPSAR